MSRKKKRCYKCEYSVDGECTHGIEDDELCVDFSSRYDRYFEDAYATLARCGSVTFPYFGRVILKRMRPVRRYNPRNRQTIELPARMRVFFRPSKALKDMAKEHK